MAAIDIPPLPAVAAVLGVLFGLIGGLTAFSAVTTRIGRNSLRMETSRSIAATVIAAGSSTLLIWLGLVGTAGGLSLASGLTHLGFALWPPLLLALLGALNGAASNVRPDGASWHMRAGILVADMLAFWLPNPAPVNGHRQHTAEDGPEFEITMASGEEVEAEERGYIENILEMGATTAHEVMTPRPDVEALDIDWESAQIVQAVAQARYSRFPVYQESIDNVIGVLHLRDLLEFLARGEGVSRLDVRGMLMKPVFIPESKKVDDVLRELQLAKSHMAIVLDEYGGTEGILTIEDLLEEIVGEIQDEFDDESAMLYQRDDGNWVVDGQLQLDELNQALGIDIDNEEVDTVGGFIIHVLGHIPEVQESIEHGGRSFTVLSVDKQRIGRVLVDGTEESPMTNG